MTTKELDIVMRKKDEQENVVIHYPATRAENVIGLQETIIGAVKPMLDLAEEINAAVDSHTHTAADVGAAASSHTHAVSDITNLLNNTVTSTSTTQAATANAVKMAYDLANTANSALSNKANIASPALTGTPTAPTAGVDTNTTQIASTAYVKSQIINNLTSNNTNRALSAEQGRILQNNKANIASPALTGTPTAPTAATATNNTQLATTNFVRNAINSYANNAPILQSGTPAGDANRLWINTNTGVAHYWASNAWNPIVGTATT